LSEAGVDVLPAAGGGEVLGDSASRLEPKQARRREDSPAAVVERVAGRAASLTESSVSHSESRSGLPTAVSVILVIFMCAKSAKK